MTQGKTTNGTLRHARQAMNLSQAEFAAAINNAGVRNGHDLRCDVRLVAKWEAGEIQWPQGRYRRALEAVTGQPCAGLGFRPPVPLSAQASQAGTAAPTVDSSDELEDPMLRREFLADTAGLAVCVTADPLALGDGRRATAAYTHDMRRTLSRLQDLEQEIGSGQLLRLAEAQVGNVARVLDSGVDTPEVRAVASWAHMLAGWMNHDAGDHGRARHLYKESLFLAQMAGDSGEVARTAAVMSFQASHLGRPREAVRLAQMGAEHAPRSGPVAALLATREARGWAMLGAEREAAAATRRAFDTHAGAGPTPGWVGFFGEGEVFGHAARNARDLDQWTRAENLIERATRDTSMPLRARVMFTLSLAETMARRGDVAGATGVVTELSPSLGRVSSGRVRTQVRTLAALPVGKDETAVTWREQMKALA